MANQLFGGFLFTDAGVAINGATADLLDRNTTTPVRATTTTNASGYWAISHATEGRFDVRITNGSSVRWHMYDTESQITTLEVAQLRIRNPADTFDYDIVPGAITADRQLNLPVITGTDTLAVLALAQTFLTGVKTFNDTILAVRNPADTFSYSIRSSAITAARDLTLPLITGTDTLAVLGLAQTFSAVKTFSAIPVMSGGAVGFPATQVASAVANELDDYEEGTWTPSVGGDATYTAQRGRYVKIGKMVWVSCDMTVNVLGTGSTTTVSGLPITAVSASISHAGPVAYFASIATSMIFLAAIVNNNAATVGFNGLAASATSMTAGVTVFGNSARVVFTACYEAAT